MDKITIETILNSAVLFGTILVTYYKHMRNIDRISDRVDMLIVEQKKYNNLQLRLAETEQRSKSNTHRLDSLEEKVWGMSGK